MKCDSVAWTGVHCPGKLEPTSSLYAQHHQHSWGRPFSITPTHLLMPSNSQPRNVAVNLFLGFPKLPLSNTLKPKNWGLPMGAHGTSHHLVSVCMQQVSEVLLAPPFLGLLGTLCRLTFRKEEPRGNEHVTNCFLQIPALPLSPLAGVLDVTES